MYFIFCVLGCSAKAAEAARTHNVKKESKAYSFEEQKWELEFKEVNIQCSIPLCTIAFCVFFNLLILTHFHCSLQEQKKKKKQQAGKSLIIDELSQKEREVYDASLKKESEIRERLQEVCFLFFLSLPCVQGSSTTWKSVISFDLWIYVLRNGVP